MTGPSYHEPVMTREVVRLLAPRDGALYLDGTAGGGGHARAILGAAAECRLVAVDIDPEAISATGRVLGDGGFTGRFRLVLGNFSEISADDLDSDGLDGALLDLGVSSHQLDDEARGFTFARGAPLDMRMARGGEDDRENAAQLLARSTREELTHLFKAYGEVVGARALAKQVARRCREGCMATSDDLVAALARTLGRLPKAQEKARVFQAVRVAVNRELESLGRGLEVIRDLLRANAVLVVISYHSLEDRIVKRAFREWSGGCVCPSGLPACACGARSLGEVVTRRPLRPSDSEIGRNHRARSARLRAWRRAA